MAVGSPTRPTSTAITSCTSWTWRTVDDEADDNDVDDWLPAWSPDGGSIAFIRTGDGQRLHVIGADGHRDRVVDGADDGAWWPAWSPDAARIAFSSTA